MEDLEALWKKILQITSSNINKPTFEMWLKTSRITNFENNTLTIGVANEMAKNWLEIHYDKTFKSALKKLFKKDIKLKFTILEDDVPDLTEIENEQLEILIEEENSSAADKNKNKVKAKENEQKIKEEFKYSPLNPKYVFDTFVVGNSNRFAHAASLAVAEAPAKAYNPLFIYGGVGLGKTHLMHAIGHYVLEQNPKTKVVYISSETFTNELINSIKDDKTEAFRNKYRHIDVLLVDDIQFLAKKERTQEEFFHTFNALHEANKQIIISSDRPPKEIPTLEDRLRSRFEWGLTTDIQAPDFETRIAILRKKTEMENLSVDDEVIIDIAKRIQANIRELEGALIRVVAYSSITKRKIDLNLAQEALKDLLPNNRHRLVDIPLIQKTVADHFNLKVEDFKAKKRTRNLSHPRQIAMYLARELTDNSLPKIGEEFGGRDHTTVMHAYEKIKENITTDPGLNATINELIEILKNG